MSHTSISSRNEPFAGAGKGRRVVIIGGGYAGVEVAKGLDAHAEVTLIEAREAFVHVPATIRAILQPELLDGLIIPYDNLLQHGRVLRARVVSIEEDGVTLENGSRVAADYIVVATGSHYATPFKPQSDTLASLRSAIHALHQQLLQAKRVAIVGAGAVGTELAGEIAHALPHIKLSLISNQARLFPMYPEKLGQALQKKLSAKGVELILNERVGQLAQTDQPYSGRISLSDGRQIDADLIFPVLGAKAQAGLLHNLPGVRVGTAGRVKTDAWMRPSSCPHLFAVGDVAEMGDGMTIVAVARQTPWLIKTIKVLLAGKALQQVSPYTPWKVAPILLPMGPNLGNSYLPQPFGVSGDFVTSRLKGRNLFIPKYQKLFRHSVSGRG